MEHGRQLRLRKSASLLPLRKSPIGLSVLLARPPVGLSRIVRRPALCNDLPRRLKTTFSSQPKNVRLRGGLDAEARTSTWQLPAPHPQTEYVIPGEFDRSKRKPLNAIWVALTICALSVLSYYAVSRYVVTAVVVQGASMLPTLHDGDRYLLNRWAYLMRAPQRGDVVVIKDPGHSDYAVKRIVGLPYDVIKFKDGKVFLNGKLFSEPYLNRGTRTSSADGRDQQIMLGPDRYFVLGDNRNISEDSRYYGSVRRDQIVGILSE
jgi:signal peptidase I